MSSRWGTVARRHLLSAGAGLALVLLGTALAYAGALHGEFQLDDEALVLDPRIRDVGGRLAELVPSLLAGGRSVLELSYAANYAVGRLDPFGFHLVNLAIHLVVVALVFAFTRTTLQRAGHARPGGLAVAVAGVFGLHPLQTQAVTYVSQRAESLASLWYLAALLLLLCAERHGGSRRGVLAWLGATGAFAAGAGTKPLVVTLPLVFVIHGFVSRDPGEAAGPVARRRALLVAPWLAAGAFLAVAFLQSLEGRGDAGWSVPGLDPVRYLLTQPRAIAAYLRLLAVPYGQNLDHDLRPYSAGDGPATAALTLLLVGLASFGAWLLFRTWRATADRYVVSTARVAGFGILWFFVVLAPSSSLLPIADPMAEHRTYLASWGIIVAVVAGGALVLERRSRHHSWVSRVGPVAVLAACAGLGSITHLRNQVWQTRLSMWSDVAEKSPRSSRAHSNLAYALIRAGQPERAIEEYRAALALTGDGRTPPPQIAQNLGATLLQLGRVPEALEALQEAAAHFPTHEGILTNLAMCHGRLGAYGEALAVARRAVAVAPSSGDAQAALGLALFSSGDVANGIAALERAVALRPDDPGKYTNLAVAYEHAGNIAGSCEAYGRLLTVAEDGAARAVAAEAIARLGCRLQR